MNISLKLAVLVTACAAVSAQASPSRDAGTVSAGALIGPNSGAGGLSPYAATGLSTGFESPFVPGTINGQQGWGVSTISSAAINGDNISTTTPIAGAQSLKITKSTTATAGTAVGAFSPVSVQTAPDTSVTSFKMRIDGVTPGAAGGADYFIAGQSPAQAFSSFKVNFNYLGPIRVLDYPGVGQTGTLAYQNTGMTWTPGTVYNISVAFIPSPTATPGATTATGSIVYSINGVPVYTADSLIAGTKVDQYVITSDSYQVAGESATFDDLSVVGVSPEPSTLAALAGVASIGLRRRRA